MQPVHVREWVAGLAEAALSPSRIRQAYQLLSAILKAAVESGYLVRSPCIGVSLLKAERREMRFLSAGEVDRLAEAVAEPYDLLIYLLAYGGLRWGEAAALRRGRCHLHRSRIEAAESLAEVGGRLHFGPTKTYQRRTVVLPGFLRDGLAAHLARRVPPGPGALVFSAPDGGPLRHANFRKRIWLPALEEAGLPPNVRIHDLRHTCAALLIAGGAHPKAIQAHLGHASIQVTLDRYGHLFPDQMDRPAEKLEATHEAISRRAAASMRHGGGAEVIEFSHRGENMVPELGERVWGGLDSNRRPADHEPADPELNYLRKLAKLLVRAITRGARLSSLRMGSRGFCGTNGACMDRCSSLGTPRSSDLDPYRSVPSRRALQGPPRASALATSLARPRRASRPHPFNCFQPSEWTAFSPSLPAGKRQYRSIARWNASCTFLPTHPSSASSAARTNVTMKNVETAATVAVWSPRISTLAGLKTSTKIPRAITRAWTAAPTAPGKSTAHSIQRTAFSGALGSSRSPCRYARHPTTMPRSTGTGGIHHPTVIPSQASPTPRSVTTKEGRDSRSFITAPVPQRARIDAPSPGGYRPTAVHHVRGWGGARRTASSAGTRRPPQPQWPEPAT